MKHLKKEFDRLTFKETVIYALALVSMAAGFVLLFLGMYMPPPGEIHSSVLTAFGTICIFASALLGISCHYAVETDKFKAEITEKMHKYTATTDAR